MVVESTKSRPSVWTVSEKNPIVVTGSDILLLTPFLQNRVDDFLFYQIVAILPSSLISFVLIKSPFRPKDRLLIYDVVVNVSPPNELNKVHEVLCAFSNFFGQFLLVVLLLSISSILLHKFWMLISQNSFHNFSPGVLFVARYSVGCFLLYVY